MIGSGAPSAMGGFRETTGYAGALLTDPSLRAFRAAGLAHGIGRTFHPRSLLLGVRAFLQGFRQGARRGQPFQQGGTFVLGPGDRVVFAWRDRFAGDHADLRRILAALPDAGA